MSNNNNNNNNDIIIIIIIEFFTSQLWLGNIHLPWDLVINRIRLSGLTCSLKSFLQLNMCQELQIFAVVYIYIFGCKLSLVRLWDSDFGITPVDDITIGITCVAFCFHIAHTSFASSWYLFCLSVIVIVYYYYYYYTGYAVAQLVETLRYKSEGRGFVSRWCHWIFHCHIPSGRIMALGLTQLRTEMSTRNISWG